MIAKISLISACPPVIFATQPATLMPISQNKFDVMQRIASYGALTITGVLRGSFPADPGESLESRKERFEPLIGAAYSWKTALDNLATAT